MTLIKAAIFDIDDTLYDLPSKTFIPSSLEGIKELQKHNIKVILATGRPPQTAVQIIEKGVFPDYIVCTNGHIILDKNSTVIKSHTFSKELVESIYQYCQKNDMGLLWKYPDLTYEYIHKDDFNQFYYKTKDSIKKVVFNNTEEHLKRCPNGGCIASTTRQNNAFNAAFSKKCVAIQIDKTTSDLLLFGISKLSGVKEVLNIESIDMKECIGFGDNLNDIEVLKECGISVCVGNGSEILKKQVTYVTDDINNDGVYKALLKFNLID